MSLVTKGQSRFFGLCPLSCKSRCNFIMKPHRMLCLAREAQQSANLPDLSILVALAEYYEVEMKELLDGERSQSMNKEMKSCRIEKERV